MIPLRSAFRPTRPCARAGRAPRALFLLARVAVSALAAPAVLAAQAGSSVHPVPPRAVRAVARSTPLRLDGRLDEPDWARAPAATDFLQSQPREGEPATQRTEVRFLYDDEALYIGARMYDSLGAAGVRTRLARRDAGTDSDELRLIFDTYHDHLGRTVFTINPSGVKGDALGPGGAGEDPSWDPVWEAATRIDSLGWTAELRIPFSQLRFPRDSVQTWGLQIVRLAARLNERSHWAFWRLNEVGGPSRYGHLEGLVIAARPRNAEALPYVVARSSHLRVEPGNPFRDAAEQDWRLGADVKYLLRSNLTLDATVNPDFGQVEVDPAVVNLTAYETFYDEKRPFFVEGAGLFSFGGLWCFVCTNASGMGLFYSRRIGRPPQGAELARAAGRYADVPESTTILGAAKLTGRTARGTSVAVLDAVTRREYARYVTEDGRVASREVEPAANYFVGRVKQDLRGGDLVVGAIATSVWRDLRDPELARRLNRHAESVGADVVLWWGRKTYRWMASVAATQVAGEPAAILRAQRSSARYFQRPDRAHGGNGLFSDAYDTTATALRGYGLYTRLSKEAGDWLWEASLNVRSPGFEANDLAAQPRADFLWMNANLARRFTRPTAWYRSLDLLAGAERQYNYDGDHTYGDLHVGFQTELPNYWRALFLGSLSDEAEDDRLTRGGPVVLRAARRDLFLSLSTDARRAVVVSLNPRYGRSAEGAQSFRMPIEVRIRPAPNVEARLGPSYERSQSTAQYVAAWDDPTATHFYGRRYLFADLDQRTFSLDTRLSLTVNPTLTLDVYAQPFIGTARFSHYKEFAAPRTLEKRVYGRNLGTVRSEMGPGGRSWTVDPDGDGPARPYTFPDPDFNFRSLRGTAVLRWEWRPGSTLYLVWTQTRAATAPLGDLRLGRDLDALFGARPDNVFLLKATYWLGL